MEQDFVKKIKEEVKALQEELHIKLPRELKVAREHGDLSENAEYHAAKERQGYVNARLGQLRKRLAEISMINFDRIPHDRVSLGSEVHLIDLDKDEELVYRLVTAEEADVQQGRISTTSPIGQALMGRKDGDEVEANTPGGVKNFEIVKLLTMHDLMKNGSAD